MRPVLRVPPAWRSSLPAPELSLVGVPSGGRRLFPNPHPIMLTALIILFCLAAMAVLVRLLYVRARVRAEYLRHLQERELIDADQDCSPWGT